tara:strand:- start:1092 stop:2789 length:1698 start_codon:yes stop_codon:yes gene_type:complete
MAGYTRTDTNNNISNGSVIDADDFDAEYNAIEAGFNASTGHSHDGTTGEGSPITKVGPTQNLIVSSATVLPKTTNTLDLGSIGAQFKNAFFDGTVDTDALTVSANATVGGTLGVTGVLSAALTGNVIGNVTGTVSNVSNHDTGDIAEGSNLYFTTARARNAVSATGNLSYNSGTGSFSFTQGNTNTVAEGSSNLYYTTARATSAAKAAVSASDNGGYGSFGYSSSTGVFSYTGPSSSDIRSVLGAGEGLDYSTQTGTISAEIATTANRGVASFNATDFSVSSGAVSLRDSAIKNIVGSMVTGNTESGISVTYQTSDDTLDFSLTKDPVITLSGAVTGSGTMTNLGNVSITTTATSDPTLTLSGDASGSATFTNLGNATLSVAVVNDSHTHDGRYYTETESNSLFTASAGDVMTGTLRFNDGKMATFGTSNDTELFCDGNHMYMDLNSGIGNFYIRDGSTIRYTFNDNGSFTASGNITAYSDERLKSDIVTIPNALETVCKLRGVNFIKDGEASTGVIAQEVQKVIPEVVLQGDEYLSVAYGNLVGVLIEAVKELKAEVETLKKGQ